MIEQFQAQTEALAAETRRQVMAVLDAWQADEISQPDAEVAIASIINRANAAAVSMADIFVAAQIEDATGVPTSATGIPPVDDSARLIKAVHTILAAPPASKLSRADVNELIRSGGLDPADWDVPAITLDTNRTIADKLIDRAEGAEHGPLAGVDFFETVNENPASDDVELLNSDDYDDFPPVWEPEPEAAAERLTRLAGAEPLETAQRASVDAMAGQDVVEGWIRQLDADPCELCRWWWRDGYVWPKTKKFQRHPGCNCQPRVVLREQGAVADEPIPGSELITFTMIGDDRYE